MVDAGMRQLWHEGWMPRHVRLIAASCLTEGLGLDWRKGRDWFAETLIDNDPAINELMWQNAGHCGIDLFYRGLEWEALPTTKEDSEYVDHWLSEDLKWSPQLLEQRTQQLGASYQEIEKEARSRRKLLQTQGLFKAAANVANSGVRVVWKRDIPNFQFGDVWGVGRVPIEEMRGGPERQTDKLREPETIR